jgi:site-specific DNA recombinase
VQVVRLYGCYRRPTSRASATGECKLPFAYDRCTSSDAYRIGDQQLCWNRQVRTDLPDAAVWEDVHRLLSEPERVQSAGERRLRGSEPESSQEVEHLSKVVANVKKNDFPIDRCLRGGVARPVGI